MSKQPTNIRAQLLEHLKELRLPAMRNCYEQEAQRAQQETLSYEQYLFELAGRVRHAWGCCISLGSLPERRYLRAVFSSMPAFAAANSNVLSVLTAFISILTC